jgi:hypothetical protein
MNKDLIERALQRLDLGSGDPLRSACLRERRALAHDVRHVLDLIWRCTGPNCRAGMVQGRFGAVQFGCRQRTHARCAARPLDRRAGLIQSRMHGWRRTAGDERREQETQNGGSQRERAPAQDTHRDTLGSGTSATRHDLAVPLLDALAQAAGALLCLCGLRLDLGQLRIHQGLLRKRARASMRLHLDRGMRRLQLLRGARQLDRRMALGTDGPRSRHGDLRSGQGLVRHGRLSASGKRHQDQRARNQASRDTLPECHTCHALCSPPSMPR